MAPSEQLKLFDADWKSAQTRRAQGPSYAPIMAVPRGRSKQRPYTAESTGRIKIKNTLLPLARGRKAGIRGQMPSDREIN